MTSELLQHGIASCQDRYYILCPELVDDAVFEDMLLTVQDHIFSFILFFAFSLLTAGVVFYGRFSKMFHYLQNLLQFESITKSYLK